MCRMRLSVHTELEQKQLAILVMVKCKKWFMEPPECPGEAGLGQALTNVPVGLVEPVFLSPWIFPGLFCALKRADLFHLLIRRANRLEI